ncbi:MAG: alpha/beta fold hydrolase [Actinomycetales bacterium]
MAQLVSHELGDGPARAVAIHGITANGLSFAALADQLRGRVGLIAPDLRGRACSAGVQEGGYGLQAHARDVIELLEGLVRPDGEPIVVLGHSMGAFVAALVAAQRPDLVRELILIDGGLAFPLPPGADGAADIDATLTAIIGPAMQRLAMTFADPDEYLAFWARHPALGELSTSQGPLGEAARGYILHDLVRDEAGVYRSSCVLEAIRADGASTLTDPATQTAVADAVAAGVPSRLLWAPRGLLDEPQGMYDEQRLAALAPPADLVIEQVPDVNHYTILFDPDAVRRVGSVVADATAN